MFIWFGNNRYHPSLPYNDQPLVALKYYLSNMAPSDSHYDFYEPSSERDNKAAGFLFLAAIIGGSIGIIKLVVYFLS